MANYRILTDSGCDVDDATLATWGVSAAQMEVLVEGEDSLPNNQIDIPTFYQKLRDGKTASTAAVNVEAFCRFFRPVLDAGEDILYLAFSSSLSSGTRQAYLIAVDELQQEYPERRIEAVDTLCGSMGQGLLVYLAAQQKQQGATLEETLAFVMKYKGHICHWFTVYDLFFLKRGGRLSATVALLGSALGIKPVMHVDDTGSLVSVSKVRGRAASIEALAKQYGATVLPENDMVFISNGDCLEDAKTLKDILEKQYGAKHVVIGNNGPVIGAHSGPGTLALFFLGSHR